MTGHEHDVLAHLADDWDAQAAQLERLPELPEYLGRDQRERHARVLRECAGNLRDRLLRLRAPADATIAREG